MAGNDQTNRGYPPEFSGSNEMPFPQGPVSDQYPTRGDPSFAPNPGAGLPVDQVINLRQQGLSNNQIVQSLQRDGYDSGRIFDAMNQADLGGPAGPPPMQFNNAPQMHTMDSFPDLPPIDDMPPPFSSGSPIVSKVEEIAEAIIDEKWEEMIKSINKIIEWKDATENRMAKLEQQFSDLKENFNNLHGAVVGKIGEYDRNILNVGTEIKAMEKVFQKILPTFTENVSELSRITRGMRVRK